MNEVIYYDKEGKKRVGIHKICEWCNKEYLCAKRFADQQKFCSQPCQSRYRWQYNRKTVNCSWCDAEVSRSNSKIALSKSGLQFCSRICKDAAQSVDGLDGFNLEHYKDGKYEYRKRALRNFGTICSKCGYDDYVQMLDVHHIDGNRDNNALTNLIVLCVWCHGLVTRDVTTHAWNGNLGL